MKPSPASDTGVAGAGAGDGAAARKLPAFASLTALLSAKLRKYISERGKNLPRRITGNCAKHQRALTVAIKRARHIALMPYVQD